MLIRNLFLSSNENCWNAALQEPGGGRRAGTPIGKINVNQRAVKLEIRKIFLKIGEAFQSAYKYVAQIFEQLLDMKYDEGIVFKAENTHAIRQKYFSRLIDCGRGIDLLVAGHSR